MKRLKVVLFVFSILLCSGIAFADTINVPGDQPTIQAGIDASFDGDIVLVQPGTYVENINFNGKAITLGSLFYTTQDTTYISQTLIDGSQPANPDSASVVFFVSGEDSTTVLTGFTLQNGQGSGHPYYNGGGITCKNSSNPTLLNVIITGNSVEDGNGGGIFMQNCNSYLENLTISNNSANYGGGISSWYSNINLENVIITGNSATGSEYSGGRGGGIYSSDSNLNLDYVTITDNSAEGGYGGGFYQNSSISNLDNVIITNNTSDYGGGIFSGMGNCTMSLENATISGNFAFAHVGGFYSDEGCNASLENVIISGNSAQYIGGIAIADNASLMNVTITNNTSTGAYYGGGGIVIAGNSIWRM